MAGGGFVLTKPLLLATLGSREAVGAGPGMAVLVLRAVVDAFGTRTEREHLLNWQPEARAGPEILPRDGGLLVAAAKCRTF